MSRIVHVDGAFVPEEEATVSLFDRGYLFADGVYEVTPVIGGRLIDADRMLARLDNSLKGLRIDWPMSRDDLLAMHRELIARNGLDEGMVYVQITRGVADRDFAFPDGARPVVSAFTKSFAVIDNPRAETGVAVALVEDVRWKLRHIKSIALLGQVLAKQQAVEHGAFEGWMVEDGHITEGTASSAYIVKDGVIITHPLTGGHILPGIRRSVILELADAAGIPIEQRPFTPDEAKAAEEAFISAATFGVLAVVRIDEATIGEGAPGPMARRLRALYVEHVKKQLA